MPSSMLNTVYDVDEVAVKHSTARARVEPGGELKGPRVRAVCVNSFDSYPPCVQDGRLGTLMCFK